MGVAALAGLLLPTAVAAVSLSETQHFLLGKSPYLHDDADPAAAGAFDGDGTPLNPSTNAPDVPVVDLSTQVLVNPCSEDQMYMDQWMRLMSTDYTVELAGTGLPTPGDTDPDNAALIETEWTITLDGGFEIPDNAMTSEGALKLFFVIWDIRRGDNATDAIDEKSIIGGFDKDSFAGDLLTGPLLADATNANAPIPFPDLLSGDPNSGDPLGSPGTHFVQGMGVKIANLPGDSSTFTADYYAGEVIGAGTDLFVFWDVYWYKIPEPGTTVMLLVGLAGVAWMRRRTH